MGNENIIYWRGLPVGYESAGRIIWFAGAPREAVEAYS